MMTAEELEEYGIEMKKFKEDLTAEGALELIFSYVTKISNEKKLDNLLVLMANMGRELIVADRCTVWLVDEHTDELWTKVAHGIDAIRIPKTAGVVGHAIADAAPIIINDAYSDSRFSPEVDKKTGYHTRNIIAIPFKNSDGDIIGAYQAINKMTKAAIFSEKDLGQLMLASTYTGNALESALLYKEIEDTQKEIIFTMAEVGESRSKETGNHVKRVAEYSRIMAKHLGMNDKECDLIKMASPMHDIGKIAIPDAVLLKPGKLDEAEYDIMKKHTVYGYDMLKHSKRNILQAASILAYQHHEKWNGKGYPMGLKGEEIHVYGRITAVADVFDALASDRVYKKAWELDRVLNLFQEEKGEHFDPRCIDAFMAGLQEILKIKEDMKDAFGEGH